MRRTQRIQAGGENTGVYSCRRGHPPETLSRNICVAPPTKDRFFGAVSSFNTIKRGTH